MGALRLLVVGVLVAGLGAGVKGEEKKADSIKDKLVGSWEVAKADKGTVPVGATIEFRKDGTAKFTVKQEGKEEVLEATYTVGKNDFTLVRKEGADGRKQKLKITTLNATTLVVEDDEGKKVELKRKK
jgi:uncharacterized protein (TIGR03066 family)